jgi:hypothetical protein
MPTKKLPYGIFAPDASDRDNPALQQAENFLPLYGSYRLIPNIVRISENPNASADTSTITGGYSHLFSAADTVEFGRPTADLNDGGAVDWPKDMGWLTYPALQNETLQFKDTKKTDPQVFYKYIDEPSPDDLDGIWAPGGVTTAGDDQQARFKLSDLVDPGTDDDHIFRTRYRIITDSGQPTPIDFGVTLRQGTTTIEAWDVEVDQTNNTDGYILDERALSSGNISSISDYTDLNVKFKANVGGPFDAHGFDEVYALPGNWTSDDGTDDLHEHITDIGDDTEFMQGPDQTSTSPGALVLLGLPDVLPPPDVLPDDYNVFQMRFRARSTAADMVLRISLKERGEQVYLDDVPVRLEETLDGGTWTTIISDFSPLGLPEDLDWNDLQIGFGAFGPPSGTGRIKVSFAELNVVNQDGVYVSWCELEVPSTKVFRRGDNQQQFVGTRTQLYEINRVYDWNEVTRTASDYGQGDEPQSWSFVTWGSDILATNFVDEIQTKGPTASVFSDLISSPGSDEYPVQGRFCAVVNNFLVVADINPDGPGAGGSGTVGSSIGTPHTVWWSAINDNTKFKLVDINTQSDYQLLIDAPGQITGLVGGEYGLVFKRNAIYRMDYRGGDIIFSFDLLSINEGTSYPHGIVKVGDDVYFWGNGGIRVLRSGQAVQNVGDGQITRYLFDAQHSPYALAQEDFSDTILVDSQVIGAYDPITHSIFWLYRPISSPIGGFPRCLVYNITEDRTSTLSLSLPPNLSDQVICYILGTHNILHSQSSILRSLFLYSVDYDASTKNHSIFQFIGRKTQEGILEGGITSSSVITGDELASSNIQINRVRPLTVVEPPHKGFDPPVATRVPNVEITITGSQDPHMKDSDEAFASWKVRDDDGWLHLDSPIQGEFFIFETVFKPGNTQIREITHLEIDYEISGGDY